MRIRNHRDFWAGIMFLALGLFFAIYAKNYSLGTAARMGPGFFPTMLGALLALLGLIIAIQSTARSNTEERVGRLGWREMFLILFSVGVFAAALPYLGLVIAVTLLIGISSLAAHDFRWKETAISIVALLGLSYLVFIRGLELQIPVWPTFFAP